MILEIPPDTFAGYIFDLDGTLIDSMPRHYQAWDAAMRQAGLRQKLDENLFYSLGGVPTRRVAELIALHYGLSLDPEVVFHEKEKLFFDLQPGTSIIPETVAFARKVAESRPVAVASGGPRDIVARSLQLAGLSALFPVVVTADDVVHGKPAPDMFLLAARLMGIAPAHCLVFEDAEPGIQAAEAASMRWVRVPSRLVPKAVGQNAVIP